ncbi:MAG TPA: hypothetical protein VGQ72_01795 [Pyrinomonadaceae bacterium]|nr:hypothetical protein [Pyrinomonadaceae bacterium]
MGSLLTFVGLHRLGFVVLAGLFSIACASVMAAESGAPPVTKSFDFRNGALGWQAGFADYPPATDNGSYELSAEIRSLPPELGVSGTGFYFHSSNHSDDLFMYLKRRLDRDDGIVAGQTYQVTFTLVFASNAQSGCIGPGSPGESVYLKAGASPAEPKELLDNSPLSAWLKMNVDKSNQHLGGIAASVTGDIANGQPCNSLNPPYVSIQRTHQHTALVNASSQGGLWLLVGTDSGYEGITAIYYQRIDVSLTPVEQQQPVLLTYKDRNGDVIGRATALDSVSLMKEPFTVLSPQNFFSSDQRTRPTLFAYSLELREGEDLTAITVEGEDSQHQVYNLPVEAVNEVPNFNWITQVTVKLPDQLQGLGNVSLSVKLRGMASNKLPVSIL